MQYILTHFSPQDTDFAAALKRSPATESQQYLTWVQELNERTLRTATTILDELLLNRDVPKLSSVVTMIQHPERVAKNRIKLGEPRHVRVTIRVSAKHNFVIKSTRTMLSLSFFCVRQTADFP